MNNWGQTTIIVEKSDKSWSVPIYHIYQGVEDGIELPGPFERLDFAAIVGHQPSPEGLGQLNPKLNFGFQDKADVSRKCHGLF